MSSTPVSSRHCVRPLLLIGALLTGSDPLQSAEPIVHTVMSSYQALPTTVTVLLPDNAVGQTLQQHFRVLYVLPVEAGSGHRWGDSLQEVQKHDLANEHQLICVFPTFADLPWYADHPDNMRLQQERSLLHDVLPLVEQNYPVKRQSDGRLLVGFSKSGWGAWSLLLRHPDVFGRAAAFDAPMMLDAPGKYGSGPIFGTAENFEHYRVTSLLQTRAPLLREKPARLALLGQGNFESEHVQVLERMQQLQIPCAHLPAPVREHSWHSGWLPQAVRWLTDARP
jgi:hypothetical protein